MSEPANHQQRSFVYRKLAEAGAKFGEHGGQLHALELNGAGDVQKLVKGVRLCDLSPLPRVGFKGRDTFQWLRDNGVVVEGLPNRADRQEDGGLCAVLSPGEVVLLSPISGKSDLVSRLEYGWTMNTHVRCYAVPRSSLSFEFLIMGEKSPSMFAKICGVDFRADKFAVGEIAQTSLARMNATVIREDFAGCPAYRLLGDSASAEYSWDCLIDAMDEFQGGPIGLNKVLSISA